MKDAQFTEFMAAFDNFQLMVFIGLLFVILGIGMIFGGQR